MSSLPLCSSQFKCMVGKPQITHILPLIAPLVDTSLIKVTWIIQKLWGKSNISPTSSSIFILVASSLILHSSTNTWVVQYLKKKQCIARAPYSTFSLPKCTAIALSLTPPPSICHQLIPEFLPYYFSTRPAHSLNSTFFSTKFTPVVSFLTQVLAIEHFEKKNIHRIMEM